MQPLSFCDWLISVSSSIVLYFYIFFTKVFTPFPQALPPLLQHSTKDADTICSCRRAPVAPAAHMHPEPGHDPLPSDPFSPSQFLLCFLEPHS